MPLHMPLFDGDIPMPYENEEPRPPISEEEEAADTERDPTCPNLETDEPAD